MQRNIDTDLLRTFLAICETGKFTAAAERVGRTQAAVSQQIKRLEDLLGQTLFDRDNRNIKLSTAGEILKNYAYKLIELNDETFLRIHEADISAVLKLGAPEVLTSTHLSHILKKFNKDHPSVALDVTCKLSDELLKDFDQGGYDIAVFLREQRHRKSGTVVHTEHLVWTQSKDFTMHEDRALPVILSPNPCIYRRLAISAIEKSKWDWRVVLTAHSLLGRISAVKNGLGVALLPEDMLDDDLIVVPSHYRLPQTPDLEMAVISHKSQNEALNTAFVNILMDYFSSHERRAA